MLYRYGLRIGLKLLARGAVIRALPFLIRPVNYWRTLEYRLVLRAAGFSAGDTVLDVGSPKLLALYLAKIVGATVFATDIDHYFLKNYASLRELEGISAEKLRLAVEDGRHLTFPDNYFDKVYSVSVLEHIPLDGDTACIQQMARVLRPGGSCLITVPFSPTPRMDYLSANRVYWASHSTGAESKVFYQRRYNEQDLFERLIDPSGLHLQELLYVGERAMAGSQRELSDFLPALSGPIQPLLSRLLHTQPAPTWRELQKPLCAFLSLQKPADAQITACTSGRPLCRMTQSSGSGGHQLPPRGRARC